MSNQNQSNVKTEVKSTIGCNPFQPLAKEVKPVACETDYHKEDDLYIREFSEISRVKMTGKTDKDFVLIKDVVVTSKVKRQDYIDSYRDDVGILNILEKVRLSGDVALLDQTHRISNPGVEKDALGRPVEDVAYFAPYQVDKVDALESYKKGVNSSKVLGSVEEFDGLSFKDIAKMSDQEVLDAITKMRSRMTPKSEVKKEGE